MGSLLCRPTPLTRRRSRRAFRLQRPLCVCELGGAGCAHAATRAPIPPTEIPGILPSDARGVAPGSHSACDPHQGSCLQARAPCPCPGPGHPSAIYDNWVPRQGSNASFPRDLLTPGIRFKRLFRLSTALGLSRTPGRRPRPLARRKERLHDSPPAGWLTRGPPGWAVHLWPQRVADLNRGSVAPTG